MLLLFLAWLATTMMARQYWNWLGSWAAQSSRGDEDNQERKIPPKEPPSGSALNFLGMRDFVELARLPIEQS